MPYAKLLNELIEVSGKTAKEIADECTKKGQKITASYISILRKEENERTPSDELSQVLEEVLGAEKDILVVESFLDKAPEPIIKALRNIYKITAEAFFMSIGNNVSQDKKDLAMKEIESQPLSRLVLSLNKEMDYDILKDKMSTTSQIDDENLNYTTNLILPTEFEVTDQGMSPILEKGDMVRIQIQTEYKNGDIVAFRAKKDDTLKYRKFMAISKDKAIMLPFNTEYQIEEYNVKDIVLFGKVDSLLRKI